jgi:hypothetical protein
MKTRAARTVCLFCVLLTASCLWFGIAPSLAEPTDAAGADRPAGAPAFTPLGPAQLEEAKTDVLEAAQTLGGRLDQDAKYGRGWRKYVKLDVLLAELRGSAAPDLEKLDSVYTQLNADYRGLELVWFVDLKSALRRYLNLARAIGKPELEAAFKEIVEKTLPERLTAFRADASPAGAADISVMLGWLADFGQAREFIASTRGEFGRQNVVVDVSRDFIASGMAQKVDETTPVCDVILGTTIRGTGKTKGEVTIAMVPSGRSAIIETVLSATTESDNVGYHGPVRAYTTGVTSLEAHKQLVITPDGIAAMPATSKASTRSTIHSICSRRGSQMVERAAWRRACQQKSEAEAIGSCHAEGRLNRRMDSEAGKTVDEANQKYQERFRQPLGERKIFPEMLAFSTTESRLRVRALRAAANQLAAPNRPPKLAGPADVAVRVHQSMINNSAATLLDGRLVEEADFLKTVEDILGEVPESLQPEEGKASWSIRFAPREAFCVTFGDSGFTVAMHAVSYARDGKDYPGMNVSAAYKIEQTGEGFVAVRQGDLRVFPPGFVEGRRQLSAREQTLREMLTKRFAKILGEKIVPKAHVELKGRWERAGQLVLSQWSAKDGWMTLAWKQAKP